MDTVTKLIVNLTRGRVICDSVVIADSAPRRLRGLLGRRSLPSGEGMLLQPAPSVHTAFMRFAIDVVFMDGTLRVNKVVPELRPWRMASAHRARAVLELASGEVERRGVAVGDQLGVVKVGDEDQVARPGPRAAAADEAGQLSTHAAEATRVILVGADRRFTSVAAALLTRRGCVVTLADGTTDIAELAKREGAEVVVLDAAVALTGAAYGATQMESLNPRVGLVVVGEQAERSFSALPVLPRWGSFDELYDAVERAAKRSSGAFE